MALASQRSGKVVRVAGCCLTAALIAVGVWVATRPVGDQHVRKQATQGAAGTVVRVDKSWDGAQLVTVLWQDQTGNSHTSHLEIDVTPPYSLDDGIDLVYAPAHPDSAVLIADATLTNDGDYRINAAFQSAVVFALAAVALATLVIWPSRQSSSFSEDSLRPARRAIRRYLRMPIGVSSLTLAVAMTVQDLSSNSLNVDDFSGLVSLLTAIPVIWLGVRLRRRQRLVRLVTIPDDAADDRAVISSIRKRRLRITKQLSDGTDEFIPQPLVAMVALAGQSTEFFDAGQSVRRYGRWPRKGPILITDNTRETLLIGFGKHRAPAASVDRPLEPAEQLDWLADLHGRRLLTEEEFAAETAKVRAPQRGY